MNDIIRVPVYYHVHSDIIRFSPNVLDFGLVPVHFDMLKLTLKGKSRSREPLVIQDVFVPITDTRLDFIMIDSKNLGNHN